MAAVCGTLRAMPGFDAERYLRIMGERLLLDGELERHGPMGSPHDDAAQALVALGAIERDRADAVLADYRPAAGARAAGGVGGPGLTLRSAPAAAPAAAPAERLVVPRTERVETSSGVLHVRYVAFGAAETRIGVRLEDDGAAAAPALIVRRGQMLPGPPRHGPPRFTLLDDRGTSVTAFLRGSSGPQGFLGLLTVQPALDPDLAWIEIDGVRVDLDEVLAPPAVTVQRLPEQPPALRHLWGRLAAGDRRFGRVDLEPAIDALVAAGALAVDAPVLADIRAVQLAVHHGQTALPLPEPWRTLLAHQSRQDGPRGSVRLGADVPPIDGITLFVVGLESLDHGFEVGFEATPGGHPERPGPHDLQWWAADDLGGRYLGQIGRWSGGEDRCEGEVGYWPALDPRARCLELMPTGTTERAVIEVELPWAP
jgi:hypothetical protein